MSAEGSWLSTERVPADIDLADGEQVRGDLHLQPLVAHRDGAETLALPLEIDGAPYLTLDLQGQGGELGQGSCPIAIRGVEVAPSH